jgi:uncharacterized protein (TIGR03437 family)
MNAKILASGAIALFILLPSLGRLSRATQRQVVTEPEAAMTTMVVQRPEFIILSPVERSAGGQNSVTFQWCIPGGPVTETYRYKIRLDKGTNACDSGIEEEFDVGTNTCLRADLSRSRYFDGVTVDFAIQATDSQNRQFCFSGRRFVINTQLSPSPPCPLSTVCPTIGNCTLTPIGIDETRNGALTITDCLSPIRPRGDGRPFADRYTFTAAAGQPIAIALNSSDFDTYLYLLSPSGTVLAENDNAAGTNSRILAGSGGLSLPTSGTYIIEATSYSPSHAGTYALSLARAVSTGSAASFSGTELAVESIAASFGQDLATATEVATAIPLPTTLAGASVRVRDSAGTERAAPLFSVAPGQINYLIPPGTANGMVDISVVRNAMVIAVGAARIVMVAPGLFAANANGQGVAAATVLRRRADGSEIFEPVARFDQAQNRFVAVPIDLGPQTDQVFLILFGTGIRHRSSLSAVSLTIGGTPAEVVYAGPQGQFVGLDQVNGRIPRSLAGRGEVDVALAVDGRTANTMRISIK